MELEELSPPVLELELELSPPVLEDELVPSPDVLELVIAPLVVSSTMPVVELPEVLSVVLSVVLDVSSARPVLSPEVDDPVPALALSLAVAVAVALMLMPVVREPVLPLSGAVVEPLPSGVPALSKGLITSPPHPSANTAIIETSCTRRINENPEARHHNRLRGNGESPVS